MLSDTEYLVTHKGLYSLTGGEFNTVLSYSLQFETNCTFSAATTVALHHMKPHYFCYNLHLKMFDFRDNSNWYNYHEANWWSHPSNTTCLLLFFTRAHNSLWIRNITLYTIYWRAFLPSTVCNTPLTEYFFFQNNSRWEWPQILETTKKTALYCKAEVKIETGKNYDGFIDTTWKEGKSSVAADYWAWALVRLEKICTELYSRIRKYATTLGRLILQYLD